LLERHRHVYQYGSQTDISGKEKQKRVDQITKLVGDSRSLLDHAVQTKAPIADEEMQPFKMGADGEYDDVRGKTRDEVLMMQKRMVDDQEQHLD